MPRSLPDDSRPFFGARPSSSRAITRRTAGLAIGAAWLAGCRSDAPVEQFSPAASWDEIVRLARGKLVRLAMWDGDPLINAYIRDWVAPRLSSNFDITLRQIGLQGSGIVTRLLADLEGGRETGDIELVWINGETFYQLRSVSALFGPFTDRLPNSTFIDWASRFIAIDFQQPVDGYECPWGNVQLAIIHNSESVPEPPRTIAAIGEWIHSHPGRFTFDNNFTGMTFLKSLLYEFADDDSAFDGPFDEATYLKASAKLWIWLRNLQPHLWRNGRTFPENVAQLHQLFSNGEVDFTMSNNDGEVDNKIAQGILPETARAYVFDSGTIRNSHYLGIPFNAPHKAAAMVAANFLISPEAQLQKALPSVWGDGTVLSPDRLPTEWRAALADIAGRVHVPPRSELERKALMEPAPEVMMRITDDFRREIINRA